MFTVVFKMIMRQRADLTQCKDSLAKDLADFKEKIAEKYPAKDHLDAVEKRIIDRIVSMEKAIGKRIDDELRRY